MPPSLLNSLLFLLGLVFGSFLSAFSYRFPRDISITRGRSFCPNCKSKISWYDNIPLLSFLLLGGKCRSCKKNISLRYPAVELATGIGFFLIGVNLPGLILFLILEAIFMIDLETRIIPDPLVFLGLSVALITFKPDTIFPGLLSGFLAASVLLFIHLATSGRGMGLGDVKFAVLGGFVVGLSSLPVWLFLAFLTGGITGLILILLGRAKMKDQIAFGPFLVGAILLTIEWGEKVKLLLKL